MGIFTRLRDAWFPPRCILCREYLQPGAFLLLCPDCLRRLPLIPAKHCPVCGSVTPSGDGICFSCHQHRPWYHKHSSVVFYTTEIRKMLLLFKFYHKRHYAPTLGILMSNYVSEDYDLITSVPISRERMAQRGYNQSELLAVQIGERCHIPYAAALQKQKNTLPQSKLNYKKRQINLNGSFAVVPEVNVKEKRILLIDDIYTTGATANECAKTLKKGGATCVDVLTFASADKKLTDALKEQEV